MLRLCFLGGLLVGTMAHAADFKLTPQTVGFAYETADGSLQYKCTHKLENADSQDWSVACGDATGKITKKYLVHLWVTAHPHNSPASKMSYEILYWVVDRSLPQSVSQGTTVWFHLRDASAIYQLEMSQWVESGLAQLELSFLP